MIVFSVHAVDQMAKRRIRHQEAREAHAAVEVTYPSEDYPDERTVIRGRTRAGRPIKLVVDNSDTNYVVTVARLDEDG